MLWKLRTYITFIVIRSVREAKLIDIFKHNISSAVEIRSATPAVLEQKPHLLMCSSKAEWTAFNWCVYIRDILNEVKYNHIFIYF